MSTPLWTQADLDALKKSVASGYLTVNYAGPPQYTVTYQSLGEMRSLLAEMNRQLNGNTAPAVRRVAFTKGFDPNRGC